MTETKTYCDHCGKQLDDMHDWVDFDLNTPDYYGKQDMCKDCAKELAKMLGKFFFNEVPEDDK